MDAETKARFDQVDQRFADLEASIDARFDAFEARFDAKIDGLVAMLMRQFERIDDRFARLEQRMTSLEQRMTSLEQRMSALEHRTTALETRVESMQVEFSERFISIDERFRTLQLCFDRFEARVTHAVATVREDFELLAGRVETLGQEVGLLKHSVDGLDRGLNGRLDDLDRGLSGRIDRVDDRLGSLDKGVVTVNARVDGLSDDVRQRFRVLIERVAGIE